MSGNKEVRTDIHVVLAEYTDSQSRARLREVITNADAHSLADALADGLDARHVEMRLRSYRESREAFAAAKAAEVEAMERFRVAKSVYDQSKK